MAKIKILRTVTFYIEVEEKKIHEFLQKEHKDPINNLLEDFYTDLDYDYVSTDIMNYDTKEHIIKF